MDLCLSIAAGKKTPTKEKRNSRSPLCSRSFLGRNRKEGLCQAVVGQGELKGEVGVLLQRKNLHRGGGTTPQKKKKKKNKEEKTKKKKKKKKTTKNKGASQQGEGIAFSGGLGEKGGGKSRPSRVDKGNAVLKKRKAAK